MNRFAIFLGLMAVVLGTAIFCPEIQSYFKGDRNREDNTVYHFENVVLNADWCRKHPEVCVID